MSMGGQIWKQTCEANPDNPLCSWTKPFDRFFEETTIGKMFINLLILWGVFMIVYIIYVSFKEELNKRKEGKNDQERQTKKMLNKRNPKTIIILGAYFLLTCWLLDSLEAVARLIGGIIGFALPFIFVWYVLRYFLNQKPEYIIAITTSIFFVILWAITKRAINIYMLWQVISWPLFFWIWFDLKK